MESTDRMKLKDKIIHNISKAIKSIQELLYYQSKDPVLAGSVVAVTLCNGDWACHKLCENLDHALLHGLKKVTHGYWQVVKQLSHKQMVKDINVLTNVTTELGKSRAWLYASLNEGNLESYIRMLCAHEKLLKKYYAKEALLLDEDRMNILLTHTSGLECVSFQLEYDVPYLDLSAYPPRNCTTSESEEYVRSVSPQYHDRTSSFQSEPEVQASSTEPICHLSSDSDSASNASFDILSQSDIGYHMKSSTVSSDSGCHTDGVLSDGAKQNCTTPTDTINKQINGATTDSISLCSVSSSGDTDRQKRLESIIPSGGDEESGDDSFQVIRMKSKKGISKPKKKKHLQSSKHNLSRNIKIDENHTEFNCQETNELNSKGSFQNKKETDSVENIAGKKTFEVDSAINFDSNHENIRKSQTGCDNQSDSKTGLASVTKFDSGIDICDSAKSDDNSSHQSTNVSDFVPSEDKETHCSGSPHLLNNSKTVQAQIESKITGICSIDNSNNYSNRAVSVGPKSNVGSDPDSSVAHQISGSPDIPQISKQSNHLSNSSAVKFHSSYSQRSQMKESFVGQQKGSNLNNQMDDRNAVKVQTSNSIWQKSGQEVEDNFDVYSSNKRNNPKQNRPAELMMGKSSFQSTTNLKDYMEYILKTPDSPPMNSKDRQEIHEREVDLSLNLDNNTKLQLMLDIFTHEDEQLLKMFVTRENHPEGDCNVVYILISNHCLYLLNYRPSAKKFVLQSMAMLQDLLFISTGINEQTLNIESIGKNNQKQRLWLTPGHQALTLAIVACLTEAVKVASEHILPANSRFSVESEVPLQIIALKKYITTELHCEAQDVTISDYSLVFWEDPSSSNNQSQDADAAYKEGTLFLRSQDPLKTHVWKLVYIVLKNSMLCISNKKSDPRPHSYLGLGGDQCVGCRLTSTTDRPHCVELILAQGGSWFLAAASQAEISEWRHALCLAVSQGTVENNTLSACIPCGSVLSCNHLFLCHEDIHTKFYRTLGRAQLEDVTGIACENESTYCVIEFESQETGILSNQWVLYFSSAQDLQRYKRALSAAWMEIYQIDLPVSKINKVTLQHHCSTISDQLRQQLTLE